MLALLGVGRLAANLVKLITLSFGFFILLIFVLTAGQVLLVLVILSVDTRQIGLVVGITDPAKQL